ncbi:hypothetical protein FDB39_12780 [Clostridium botulinum]|nr:hypothetical protein [Clostridium botulinum]
MSVLVIVILIIAVLEIVTGISKSKYKKRENEKAESKQKQLYTEMNIDNLDNIQNYLTKDKETNKFKKYNIKIIFVIIIVIVSLGSFLLGKLTSQTDTTAIKTNNDKISSTEVDNYNNQDLILDAKQLLGANKKTLDNMLNINGVQDYSEPYVYNYGENSAVFDDNGICLALHLDTENKNYKSYDEDKILKKYGIDLTGSSYVGDPSIGKHYSEVKNFNEVQIWYNNDHNIRTISFYPKGIKGLNYFLDNRSKNNSNINKTSNSKDEINNIRTERKKYNIIYDNNKSDLYNDYAYELETLEGSTQNLISIDKNNINICYDKYNDYINILWNDLKNQCPQEQFKKLTKDENDWINKKISKYPTCDSKNGTFKDKIGAIKMTDERIGVLLNHLK